MKALAIALVIAASASTALAQGAPTTVSFAARLADASTPITGNHDFVFTLYDAATGGNVIWSETRSAIAVPTDGVLYLDLGTNTPLDSTVFGGAARYLEITLDGNVSDARILIESVPYALRSARSAAADNADNLGGHVPSFFQRAVTNSCSGSQVLQSIDPVTGAETCLVPAGTLFNAGNGLALAGTTFSIDPTKTQARVTGSCATGAIQAVDQAGTTPTCLAAGTGLTFTAGTDTFDADFNAVQARLAGGGCGAAAMLSSVDAAGNPTCINAGTTLSVSGGNINVNTATGGVQARVTGTCAVGAAIATIAADGTATCNGPFVTTAGNNNNGQTTNSTTYVDLATAGPSTTVTVAASGVVLVAISAAIQPTNGNDAFVGFATDGTNPANDAQAMSAHSTLSSFGATYRLTGLTAGSHTFKLVYRVSGGGNATFSNRNIIVTPLAN